MKSITPFFVEKPWGGHYLAHQFKRPAAKLGEAWLLSTLPEGESTVDGVKLSQTLGQELPYLVKIIDAQEPLSVQVHPNDEWAKQLENSRGKTECWLILEAVEGAGVYLGLKPHTDESTIRTAIAHDRGVQDLLVFHPVRRGDFISVPAGTIHAIGAGVTLLEVQQASGITYRIWDWGRQDRELHVDKSMKVANFSAEHGILFNVFASATPRVLLEHADFQCHFNQGDGKGWYVNLENFQVQQSPPTAPFIFVK